MHVDLLAIARGEVTISATLHRGDHQSLGPETTCARSGRRSEEASQALRSLTAGIPQLEQARDAPGGKRHAQGPRPLHGLVEDRQLTFLEHPAVG